MVAWHSLSFLAAVSVGLFFLQGKVVSFITKQDNLSHFQIVVVMCMDKNNEIQDYFYKMIFVYFIDYQNCSNLEQCLLGAY